MKKSTLSNIKVFILAFLSAFIFLLSNNVVAKSSRSKKSNLKNSHDQTMEPIDPRLYILAGTRIRIKNYEKKTEIYHIINDAEPEGLFLFVTRDTLLKGIKRLERDKLILKPKHVLGQMFTTDEDMVILEQEQILKIMKQKKITSY